MKTFFLILCSVTLACAEDLSNIQAFVDSSTKFTTTLYDEVLVDNSDNILISSFSLETILALTQSGAVGATGAEIRSALFLPDTKEATDAEIKDVLPEIESDQYTLKTANKVYVENNFAIKADFQKVATDVYKAGFENVEFAENVATAAEINEWVEEQTENKIHDVITPGDVDGSTRVVLVNALYFQGNWSVPFDSFDTRKIPFFLTQEDKIEVDAMYAESVRMGISEDSDLDATILELPFLGTDASMVIVLPNQKEGIAVLEKQTKSFFKSPKFVKEDVRVILPKFKIENSIDYVPILQKLGVQTAFVPGFADFSGIAGYQGDIVINKVTQKTYIKVNEGGVEAAAATGVVGTTVVPPPPKVIFNVDHPFAFYIQVKGIILFEGRVLKPEYEE